MLSRKDLIEYLTDYRESARNMAKSARAAGKIGLYQFEAGRMAGAEFAIKIIESRKLKKKES